ncbi:MAG: alpha/beta hydrolase [Desulfuromonadales bacterium]|nr:MAG: alpha/beta hydrolase [Desulfuromonadales bacterium]
MDQSVIRVITLVALAYAGYAALCFCAQRALIYPGRAITVDAQPPAASARLVPFWLDTSHGRVEAWFLPAKGVLPGERRPVVIFFHGNGEVIDFLPEQAEGFRELGMGVLLVEYPGYGRSGGTPSEAGITAAAVAAYDSVTKRSDVDSGRVVAFGRSLGGGAACALAGQRPVAALVLQAPFTSLRPFARRMLLPGFLLRDLFDNRKAVAAFAGPVLILHGSHDDIIPFAQGEELARTARNGQLVALSCAHNDCPPDWREFYGIIGTFLTRHGLLTAPDVRGGG